MKTALVLGGGAALGAAHVGVLQVFEEAGLDFPIVIGTSAGGIVATGYAAGFSAARIAELVLGASWAQFGAVTLEPRLGLLDTSVAAAAVEALLGPEPAFDTLPRSLGLVATDLRARRPVLLRDGPLTSAVLATIAVPGIFPPVARDDTLLVDGVLTSNVPVWAAHVMGADRIVAVRLRAPWIRGPVARRLAWVVEDAEPDVLIEPETSRFSKWSSADLPGLIEAGRLAATASLDAVLAALS